MADYFQTGAAATEGAAAGTAQPANGDANMDDEILVGPEDLITPKLY